MIIKVNIPAPADILASRRLSAVLTRSKFCLALSASGILDGGDAVAAAGGAWPVSMVDFLSYLDAAQSVDVQIEWAAAGVIERLNPFVLVLASWLGISDVEVDALFGIEQPEPAA